MPAADQDDTEAPRMKRISQGGKPFGRPRLERVTSRRVHHNPRLPGQSGGVQHCGAPRACRPPVQRGADGRERPVCPNTPAPSRDTQPYAWRRTGLPDNPYSTACATGACGVNPKRNGRARHDADERRTIAVRQINHTVITPGTEACEAIGFASEGGRASME